MATIAPTSNYNHGIIALWYETLCPARMLAPHLAYSIYVQLKLTDTHRLLVGSLVSTVPGARDTAAFGKDLCLLM